MLSVANDAYDAAAVIASQNIIMRCTNSSQIYHHGVYNSLFSGKVLCDGEYFDHPLIDIVARDVTDLNVDTQVRIFHEYAVRAGTHLFWPEI